VTLHFAARPLHVALSEKSSMMRLKVEVFDDKAKFRDLEFDLSYFQKQLCQCHLFRLKA
jgi:hypothetical protein